MGNISNTHPGNKKYCMCRILVQKLWDKTLWRPWHIWG